MNARRPHADALQHETAPRLRHEYVAGLRFDKEPCHAVRTGRGLRWAKLVWPEYGGADALTGNACAIRQALGLLAMRKVDAGEALAVRQRADGWRLPGLPAHGTVHRGTTLKILAALAHEAILRGGVCLLDVLIDDRHLRHGDPPRSSRRLVTIVGVEVEDAPGQRVHTLLLLDPSDALPWSSGHNARLPITGASEIVTVHQATGHLLRCRISALIEWAPTQAQP
jgi:hypothetical protein